MYTIIKWEFSCLKFPFRDTEWPFRDTEWPFRDTEWQFRVTEWPFRVTEWRFILYYLNNKLHLFQRVDAVVAIIVYEMQQSIGAYMMYAGIELLACSNIFIGVKARAAIESGIVLAYYNIVIAIYGKGVIVVKALQDVVE